MRKKKVVFKAKHNILELYHQIEVQLLQLKNTKIPKKYEEFGLVISVQDGVAIVSGLKNTGLTETVQFRKGILGMVSTLERDITRICLMGSDSAVKPGDTVFRLEKNIEIITGQNLLGRVVDSIGNPLDGLGEISKEGEFIVKEDIILKDPLANIDLIEKELGRAEEILNFYEAEDNANFRKAVKKLMFLMSFTSTNIEVKSPTIMQRMSIFQPLHTGTKVIDALIPIGRGQRELILGDRNTGKTTLAIDAIINQTHHNFYNPCDQIACVYVAIGQRQSKVQEVVNLLTKHNSLNNTAIVFAPSYSPVLLQFIAPYSGTTIAEYFRDRGRHSLVIYDDLTKHAQLHRQMSLLLKTPPGREAYPGDVFYVHSRLLERAAKLSKEELGGSLTAIPVIETFDGDATSYIPTNVISITDGQIYLRQDLFFSGIKPGVNINFSVSRVGSAAQIEPMKLLCGKLKLQMALYNDYKIFSRFTSDLDPSIKQLLIRGDRLLEIFKQKANKPLPIQNQILSIYAAAKGFLDNIPLSKIADFENELFEYAEHNAIWYPFYISFIEEIDEAITNTLIASFILTKYNKKQV